MSHAPRLPALALRSRSWAVARRHRHLRLLAKRDPSKGEVTHAIKGVDVAPPAKR